jgi:hypothetical protein
LGNLTLTWRSVSNSGQAKSKARGLKYWSPEGRTEGLKRERRKERKKEEKRGEFNDVFY